METDQGDGNPQVMREPNRLAARASPVSIAHELCNQLQVIASALKLLQRALVSEASPSIDVILSGAHASLERAGQLSRNIVDAEASDAPRTRPTSITERLAALRNVILLAAGPAIAVEFGVADDVPEVLCAAEALDDAILNLVLNAAHAMPGGGRISIFATRDIVEGDFLPSAVFRVADTGCGMPAEIAARAFEPRFTTKPRGEGSGVGLSSVASFASSTGGSAELETRPGIGTVVTLRLPGLIRCARVTTRANQN